MITTIILAIIACASTVWAFIERNGKKILAKLLDGLNIDMDILKGDLKHSKAMLAEEKQLRASERTKLFDLQKKFDDVMASPAAPPEAKAMVAPEVVSNAIDVTALVDVNEEFKMDGDDRTVFFEFYKDARNPKELRWRLKAKNNKILADSGEGYGTKQNLKKALSVMLNAILKGEVKSRWKK